MKRQNFKTRLSLFILGFIQIFFVSVNTYFISKEIYFGVLFSAFTINMIYTMNVKRIVYGCFYDNVSYSLGATLGSVFGLYLSSNLMEYLKF
jgi:hypothetical protein